MNCKRRGRTQDGLQEEGMNCKRGKDTGGTERGGDELPEERLDTRWTARERN